MSLTKLKRTRTDRIQMSLDRLARTDMPALTARTGKEAIAALKSAMDAWKLTTATFQKACGDAINAGVTLDEMPNESNAGPHPVLGALVKQDAVVLVNAVLETENEWRKRTGNPCLDTPSTREQFEFWEKHLDYSMAEYSLGCQIVKYYVSLTPFPHPLSYAPGTFYTEEELETALDSKVTHGYTWCYPAAVYEESDEE